MRHQRQRARAAVGTVVAAVALAAVTGPTLAGPAAATTAPAAARTAAGTGLRQVVVSGAPGSLSQVREAVRGAGGTVVEELAIIDGVSARVPASALAGLRSAPGVRAVTPDTPGHLMAVDPALGYDTTKDPGSLLFASQVVHASQAWTKGVTGKGVDVALIDSGVVPVQGLTSGNVVTGPDLSFESQDPTRAGKDTFGHGTHMASIIAGRDAVATGTTYAKADSHQFTGVAPDARVVSVKVASSDGAADVSQVIAGIDWVTQHAHSNGLNIRVLNLSYGTDSVQDPGTDPLDYAVEQAWRAGITVVVSAGNDGTSRQELADPANDPLVVAVGAEDPGGTLSAGDDTIPAFSQRGTSTRYVDVIAPGVHLLGLRAPNGSIDQANPGARVGTRFFRGSGTSQAAAVVSGLSALYLSKFPSATPDQVKDALQHNSVKPSATKSLWTGVGVPQADKLVGYVPNPKSPQQVGAATGRGTLEGARGSSHVTDGVSVLTGEQDIFGQAWIPSTWVGLSAAGTAWSGGAWNGSVWTGSALADPITWSAAAWTGTDWAASTWRDAGWDASTWRSASWDASTWRDAGWSSASWS